MKIKITTDRKPWVNDAPQDMGSEVECSDADAKALIDNAFAEAVAKPAPARVAK